MNRKIGEKSLRKLVKLGKISLAVTLPREAVLRLGWKDGQKVEVVWRGKRIIIEDWKE